MNDQVTAAKGSPWQPIPRYISAEECGEDSAKWSNMKECMHLPSHASPSGIGMCKLDSLLKDVCTLSPH